VRVRGRSRPGAGERQRPRPGGGPLDPWRGDPVAAVLLFVTFLGGYALFYATLPVYYSYYFMLIMPWTALLTAWVAVDVVRFLVGEARHATGCRRPPTRRPPRHARSAAGASARRARSGRGRCPALAPRSPGAPAPSSAAPWCWSACSASARHPRRRAEEMGESSASETWRDSPYLPATVNRLVRRLSGPRPTIPRTRPSAIGHYLQHETMASPAIDDFVRVVRSECLPGERIFASTHWSLRRLGLGLRARRNLADTNPHRWKAHESTPEDWVAALEAITWISPSQARQRACQGAGHASLPHRHVPPRGRGVGRPLCGPRRTASPRA